MLQVLSDVSLGPDRKSGSVSVAISSVHDQDAAQTRQSFATVEDHRHAARYRSPARQAQSLTARAVLRALIESVTAIPGTAWGIDAGSRRVRTTMPDGRDQQMHVSVSHSHDMVACAVSEERSVGVDIEYCRPDRDVRALANFAFCSDEIVAVGTGGAAVFYQIWTTREAIAKAAGVELVTTLRRPLNRTPIRSGVFGARLNERRIFVEHRSVGDDYSLALAVADPSAVRRDNNTTAGDTTHFASKAIPREHGAISTRHRLRSACSQSLTD